MPTIIQNLDELKKCSPSLCSDFITENLKKIKQICDSEYYDQSFFGNAALNRKMLLDSRIAEYLKPEVIKYLFSNTPKSPTKIKRNTSPGGEINLHDAIYYGFKQGLQVIHKMPSNEFNYSLGKYQLQHKDFTENTLSIVKNIKLAAVDTTEIEAEKVCVVDASFRERYDRIVSTIRLLKLAKKSESLLRVPTYTSEDMRGQVRSGFKMLVDLLGIQNLEQMNLSDFCTKFLQNEKVIFNGVVSHLFYDRAHIEAALEQNTQYNLNGQKYTFEAIFREMIRQLIDNSSDYPVSVIEQFYVRFEQVEIDLETRFEKPDTIQLNALKQAALDYRLHLKQKVLADGFQIQENTITQLFEGQPTEKQRKLLYRYQAISDLEFKLKDKEKLEKSDITDAKTALQTCLTNKPDWFERPFLQKLMDILSLGILPLYRSFFSKETRLEQDFLVGIFPGLKKSP